MAANGWLLDTSFLISLADPNRTNHHTAAEYFRYALAKKIKLYISTLAIAEFSQKQSIADLGLSAFVIAPFNAPEAILAGALAESLDRDEGDDRASLKVDVMLLAQAEKLGALVLTEDTKSMAKYGARLKAIAAVAIDVVTLNQGFDPHRLEDPQAPGLPIKTVERAP